MVLVSVLLYRETVTALQVEQKIDFFPHVWCVPYVSAAVAPGLATGPEKVYQLAGVCLPLLRLNQR